MKFCKALQKVADASDPSYRPYWTDYKKLKKLVKAIVTNDSRGNKSDFQVEKTKLAPIPICDDDDDLYANKQVFKSHIDERDVASREEYRSQSEQRRQQPCQSTAKSLSHKGVKRTKAELQHNPSEVAFFQFLHAELGKASNFFEKTEKQFTAREEIVRVGMELLKKPPAESVKDRWSVFSRAVFMLYKDLMLLETFAIMNYFAFSKILKKHDKLTGHATRGPFMMNVVNKANFTNYPKIMQMIERCQVLYNDASRRLVLDMRGEDGQLFLHMVQQMQHGDGSPIAKERPFLAHAREAGSELQSIADDSLDRKPCALSREELMRRRAADNTEQSEEDQREEVFQQRAEGPRPRKKRKDDRGRTPGSSI